MNTSLNISNNIILKKTDKMNEFLLCFLNENSIMNNLESDLPKEDIQTILLNIGIPSNLLGYHYIIYAMDLILSDENYLHSITKMLYVDIAVKFKTTASRVERAIRNAISVGWTNGNLEYINHLFYNSVNPLKGTPTNSQLLSRIYFYMTNH